MDQQDNITGMDLRPMLATLAEAPLKQKGLVYEPKYDGIRALVEIVPSAKGAKARIWSRNGNEKTAQFPAIVRALEAAGRKLKAPVVLDGEIVGARRARPSGGVPAAAGPDAPHRRARDVERAEQAQPATFIAFDILRDGKADLTRLPLTERRKRLTIFDQIFRLKAEASNQQVASALRRKIKSSGSASRSQTTRPRCTRGR